MNDQVWYVYQNGQQLGPFGDDQIKQMTTTKMIAQEAYLFKVGWKDWRPIEDCGEELGMDVPKPEAEKESDRRVTAPRATVSGRVIVHNNGQLVIGGGVNISSTGIFVETKDQIFTVGEKLKLSVRIENFSRPFNVVAQVVRYNSDPEKAVGYGLRFEDLDEEIGKEIQQSVDASNEDNVNTKAAQ